MIELQKTTPEDLESLFEFQTSEAGIQMAAFTSPDPHNKTAYLEKWRKLVANPNIRMQTIRLNNQIVGSVVHFDMMNETNVSYWIDEAHWGKGIATGALQAFVAGATKRPLYARVAFDNYGSQKVLEKSGFKAIGEEQGFANARQQEIKEFVYRLD